MLPRRYSALDPWAYAAAMGAAVLALGGLLWLALAVAGHGALSAGALGRCALSGLVWFVANSAYILAIDLAGVARANAYKNLTALFATVFALVLTGERLAPGQAVAACAGSALIVTAALLLGAARRGSGLAQGPRALGALGLLCGLVAAAGIGYYLVPALPVLQAGPLGWVRYQAALGVAGGLASLLPHAARRAAGRARPLVWTRAAPGLPPGGARLPDVRLPLAAGALWFCGSALVTPATLLVGLAISWPLSQLSFYVTLAWGVVRLREIDVARARPAIWTACAATLAALVLFGAARA